MRMAKACDVDEPTAYLVAQTLLGSWPIGEDRLLDYLRKAIRECKQYTSWNDPNDHYESRVFELATACLTEPVARSLTAVVADNEQATRATTLASKLLQLTIPGTPDVYQGTELVAPALVDPDNRRPVDYELRDIVLGRLDVEQSGRDSADDLSAEKLWVTSRALRLRRDDPSSFGPAASYQPLTSSSPHLLGFLRGDRVATLVTRWPGLLARTGWGDSSVRLPDAGWTDVLTSRRHVGGGDGLRCADVLAELPVALLVREDA